MNNHVLLKTKISQPTSRRQIVDRPQWLGRIARGMDFKLSAVNAPAGSGKTTLLGQWINRSEHKVAWLSLDERENDLRRFWRYAVYSLSQQISPDMENRLLPLVAGFAPGTVSSFIDVLLNELYEFSRPLAFVLDDYHVIWNDEIHVSLEYMIEYLPDSVHLFIASRTELPFKGYTRWLARRELNVVAEGGLAFSEEEAGRLCRNIMGKPLSGPVVRMLVQKTEGWAAGLQLALISMQQEEDSGRFMHDFSGRDRGITHYLFHEVLSGLEEPLRRFLLDTSILKRLNAEICAEITGERESKAMLRALKSRGLFLLPLDSNEEWYRYHQLFAEYLEHELKQQAPERWKALHGKASRAYARSGWLEESIDHAQHAEEYAAASALINRYVETALQKGELGTVLVWLEQFPQTTPCRSVSPCCMRLFLSAPAASRKPRTYCSVLKPRCWV
ncbi:hypothetical protein J7E73_31605 [Paenibacillus albidus]|uniref:hypothetical protein n=1 Tax=Paenibacillus albidus TaxID=2041023 RepID=UPI001BE64FDC|nr:hypothetical protein [Paenibacillus albidus]MBT2293560.1 hypothetical protein [Paenibacillus albidus]